MRLATYEYQGRVRYGLVVASPHEGRDWVFEPTRVEQVIDDRMRIKAGFSPWTRPIFMEDKQWPGTLVELLSLGSSGVDAMRRMGDFLARFIEQGDPVLLHQAGQPIDAVWLRPPIPAPGLVLGVVGNNAGFLRMDPSRGRNLHHPACHQRTQTSLIGHGEPIVVPPDGDPVAGTTELGIVIGAGGRDIPREQAMRHVAGFVVVNDLVHHGYRARLGTGGARFHAANVASWLEKASDTMCAVGPYLVTPEAVGDPYDLLCYYREGGILRNRAHTSALACGIEEFIYWLSQFITLRPGMILHFGAAGRDGIVLDPAAQVSEDYHIEIEIEQVGVLRNPVVRLAQGDWRDPRSPSRRIHPSPLVRDLTAAGQDSITCPEAWQARQTRHFWALLANFAGSEERTGIAPGPHCLAYNTPTTALVNSGASVLLPPRARAITAACELGVVIKSVARAVTPEEAPRFVLGYVVIAALRDSSFDDYLIAPHILAAGVPRQYERWPDGFNICSSRPVLPGNIREREMSVAVDGVGSASSSTDAYLLAAPAIIAELSAYITLLPGDVISLGQTEAVLTIPADRLLPAGTRLCASIAGFEPVDATLMDERRTAITGDLRPIYR